MANAPLDTDSADFFKKHFVIPATSESSKSRAPPRLPIGAGHMTSDLMRIKMRPITCWSGPPGILFSSFFGGSFCRRHRLWQTSLTPFDVADCRAKILGTFEPYKANVLGPQSSGMTHFFFLAVCLRTLGWGGSRGFPVGTDGWARWAESIGPVSTSLMLQDEH